ncbi:MAG TPA: AMIN domain-containing protein [Longimicrobiales bacterium]|nr:AMIN domain-containing protein [Longimicrobiales bacterium]
MNAALALWAALAAVPVAGLQPAEPNVADDPPGSVAEASSDVRALRIVASGDRTVVEIDVDGPAAPSDYLLSGPARLVIDVPGARHALPAYRFPGIDRGGVLGVRTSQFKPDVVRVVIELKAPVEYAVERRQGIIRISFPNPDGAFEAWATGPAGGAEAAAPPAEDGIAPRTTAVRTAPAAGRLAAPAIPQAAQEPRITVVFEDEPIRSVIATFSAFSGRSIVVGAQVDAMVDATINDQPWDVALQAILRAHGLEARETESGIIRVDKLEELRRIETLEPTITQQFRIRYASVDSIVPSIEPLLSDSGRIAKSGNTNTLIVTDRQSVVERITPVIDQLDVRTPQVTVAAKIIFVDRTAIEELGIIYDIKDSEGNSLNRVTPGPFDTDGDGVIDPNEQTNDNVVLLGGSSIAALANANNRVTAPSLQILSSLVLGRHTLVGFLEALQQLNLTDIQAVPSIRTMDNRTARVQVGERTPIRVLDAQSQGGTGGPRASVSIEETGIILEITPHVTGDQVLLEVHAERSNIALAPSDIGVTFQTQEADTQVLLDDGETAVISGLTLIEKTEVRTGIPLLMDLPLLGALFRTTQERENKRDLLIMVTPYIEKAGDL